jgi:BirA family transcriptional regulator, biotin operon repressor / biotin---[acetyl-CoA-carboxylase] ligase
MPFNTALHILDTIDSTNLYAMQQIRDEMAEDGNAWLALEQLQGKGRLQRSWVMEKGSAIALSLVLNMVNKPISEPFLLSMATALAVKKMISNYIEKPIITIKWPNDIYINNKKVSGILIENIWQANTWQWAVIGIGINVLQHEFLEHLPNATSIAQHVVNNDNLNIITMTQQLLTEMVQQVALLLTDEEETAYQYNMALYKRNEHIQFTHDNHMYTGKLVAVVPNGNILINNNGSTLYNLETITIQI